MSEQIELLPMTNAGADSEGRCAGAPGWASSDLAKLPVLGIRQPWASSIIHLGKDVENRIWNGWYLERQLATVRKTGRFLIHASKGIDRDDVDGWKDLTKERRLPLFSKEKHGIHTVRDLPLGGIVGVATFAGWVTQSDSPWFVGPGAIVMTDVQPLDFMPVKGALGFFRLPNRPG